MLLIQSGFTIVTLALLLAYLNYRFIHMHSASAIMSASLIISIFILILNQVGLHTLEQRIAQHLQLLHFHQVLLDGLLGFLLFASALNVNVTDMKKQKWEISVLASLGVLLSAFSIAGILYFLLPLRFIDCLLFGALISPTDPLAVVAILRQVGTPRNLSTYLTGESLLNIGMGIALFITIYPLAWSTNPPHAPLLILLFLQHIIGGVVYGLILGVLATLLMKSVQDHTIAIFITLLVPTGGYLLAQTLHLSGPLAMVVAGVYMGRPSHLKTAHHLRYNIHVFWEILAELLNAILFLLVGFLLLVMPYQGAYIFMAIPIVLFVRFVIVSIPLKLFKNRQHHYPGTLSILTWGGLRGGVALALALLIPNGVARDIILQMTYAVVVFSILIQGTTLRLLIQQSKKRYLLDR